MISYVFPIFSLLTLKFTLQLSKEVRSEDPPSLNAFSLAQYDYKLSSGKGSGN
jgi:hypothetical protein